MCQGEIEKLCKASQSCHERKVARLLARPLRACANRLRATARPAIPAVAAPSFSNESPYDDDHLREGNPEVNDLIPTLGTPYELLVGVLPGVGAFYDPPSGRV